MHSCYAHHRAISPFPNWVVEDARKVFRGISDSVVATREIVYSNEFSFKEYSGKKVLIVGGGPSTMRMDFSKHDYDYLWSCNHFFLNPVLKDIKVDLAMLMAEVNFRDERLLEYRQKFEPYLGFEVHDKWFTEQFDAYDKYFFMHTRFYSRLGIGVRMILFAAALGAQEVSFVGLDGYKPIYEGSHAFQPGKKTLPSNFSEDAYIKQYEHFWEYCQSVYVKTKFINLGDGHDLHKGII